MYIWFFYKQKKIYLITVNKIICWGGYTELDCMCLVSPFIFSFYDVFDLWICPLNSPIFQCIYLCKCINEAVDIYKRINQALGQVLHSQAHILFNLQWVFSNNLKEKMSSKFLPVLFLLVQIFVLMQLKLFYKDYGWKQMSDFFKITSFFIHLIQLVSKFVSLLFPNSLVVQLVEVEIW